jgi:hypothetical protein
MDKIGACAVIKNLQKKGKIPKENHEDMVIARHFLMIPLQIHRF